MDEGTSPDDSEQHWGLVRRDGTPKPAFQAIATLLGAMAHTSGSPRSVAPVPRLTVPGAGPDLRQMVFVRDDGSAVAALWRAVRCWDPVRGVDIPVRAHVQRILLDTAPRFCRSMPLDAAAWQDHDPATSLDLPVGATVTLLWFG